MNGRKCLIPIITTPPTPADVAVGAEAPLELGQDIEPGLERELEHEKAP